MELVHNNTKPDRAKMPYDNQIGEQYLLQRRRSLRLGLSKSLTIPYIIRHLNSIDTGKDVPMVIDFGCSDGLMLKEIQESASNKVIQLIGVDFNKNVIQRAQKNHPNLKFYNKDIVNGPIRELHNKVDIALCVNTLHEIFSFNSYNGKFNPQKGHVALRNALKNIILTIEKGGLFVLFDGIETYSDLEEKITIKFLNKTAERNLKKFKKEYRPYEIKAKKLGDLEYEIDLRSFTRFITKYRFLDSVLWKLEREETYQYYNKYEFLQIFKEYNLKIEAMNLISPNLGNWSKLLEIKSNNRTYPYEHILLIGKKI